MLIPEEAIAMKRGQAYVPTLWREEKSPKSSNSVKESGMDSYTNETFSSRAPDIGSIKRRPGFQRQDFEDKPPLPEELGINQDNIMQKMVIQEATLDLGSLKQMPGLQEKGFENETPLLEELGINQDHIMQKMVILEAAMDLGSFKLRPGVQRQDFKEKPPPLEEREEVDIDQNHIIEKMVIRQGVQGQNLEEESPPIEKFVNNHDHIMQKTLTVLNPMRSTVWRHLHCWTNYDGG